MSETGIFGTFWKTCVAEIMYHKYTIVSVSNTAGRSQPYSMASPMCRNKVVDQHISEVIFLCYFVLFIKTEKQHEDLHVACGEGYERNYVRQKACDHII